MKIRGVNYDTGTLFGSVPTRVSWHLEDVQRDLSAIADELHCNAVNLFGTDVGRLVEAGRLARKVGLNVLLQPRLIDGAPEEILAHLSSCAMAAERLRVEMGDVTLNCGCELTVFSRGIIPGRDYNERADLLAKPWWWPVHPWFSRKLNGLLARAANVSRANFSGPITYAAGLWERVDWSRFDIVGLNYYRLKYNRLGYARRLGRFHRFGKPVVITEFGCCAFEGAADLGPAGHGAVSYENGAAKLKLGYRRDEGEQARYLSELLDIFQVENVDGAFVFEFVEPYKPHSDDPQADLDMAGYGLVKTCGGAPNRRIAWERKAAFHAVARIYGNADNDRATEPAETRLG